MTDHIAIKVRLEAGLRSLQAAYALLAKELPKDKDEALRTATLHALGETHAAIQQCETARREATHG
jgi:hypothetical protein